MPRVIISLVVAFALIFGAFLIKHNVNAANDQKTALIATEINTLNTPAIQAYEQQLQAQAASDSSTTDASTNSAYPSVNASNSSSTPLNATQELSQNLFTQYMSLKESGVDVSTDVAQQLANNLLSQTYQTGTSTVYTEENLLINANPAKQDIANYGNGLGAALSIPLPAGAQTELDIFQTFAQSNDISTLPQLSQNITRYMTIEKMLLATPVPSIFVKDHLAIMNAISEIIHDIEVVQTSATDPVGSETALADYQNTVQTLTNTLGDEKTIFLQNNIVFSATDPGYIITK